MRTTTTSTTVTCEQCGKSYGPVDGAVTSPPGWQPPITIGSGNPLDFDSAECAVQYFQKRAEAQAL